MNPAAGDGAWSQAEPFGQITSNQQDDFSDFLAYESMDMDFSNFENLDSSGDLVPPHMRTSIGNEALRYRRQDSDGGPMDRQAFQNDVRFQQSQFNALRINEAVQMQQQNGGMVVPDQQHPHQQQYRGHYSIPPTPNSSKMHPNTPGYEVDPRSHPMAGMQIRHNHQHQGDLTPQMSPDIGTSDTAFSYVPEFIAPSYLSPLTSPAINPQNAKQANYSQPGTANTSLSASPAPMMLDPADEASEKLDDRPRKTRRKEPTPRAPAPASTPKTKGSDVALARSRRQSGANAKMKPKGAVAKQLEQSQPSSAMSSAGSQSNSPQPMQEAQMAPPPRPGSSAMTPNFGPPGVQPQGEANGIPPATPASLMKMPPSARGSGKGNTSHSGSHSGEDSASAIDELTLPEAATSNRNTSVPITPRLVTNLSFQSGVSASPQVDGSISSTASPQGANGSNVESKGSRTAKKRNSTNQSLVSPALRPKISPSIKPLLPGDGSGISNDTHALLLASKSNYQNILEGNTLPGVNYPSELSTNLTSKRTSHKIAEQGRRNRINLALQEMQTLLPPTTTRKSSKEADEQSSPVIEPKTPRTPGAAGPSASSKAATVEQAIDHIKFLQQNNQAKDEELDKLREENAALQAKLKGNP